jgi:hypothetical protein
MAVFFGVWSIKKDFSNDFIFFSFYTPKNTAIFGVWSIFKLISAFKTAQGNNIMAPRVQFPYILIAVFPPLL